MTGRYRLTKKMNMNAFPEELPVRIFKQLPYPLRETLDVASRILAKFRVFLPDRPGSLAEFASTIAGAGGNISFFHYDRSIDSSRVAVEVQLAGEEGLRTLLDSLRNSHYSFESPSARQDEVEVTAVENILEVKVRLENRPGTLAAFAVLLAKHDANVIYMLYDEAIDAESADIAMVTRDTAEIDKLMDAMNQQGYYYRVIYRGADEQAAANVIGLKMVEKFFLRLRKLLPASDITEIKTLVGSSQDLYQDLVQFYAEAGKNLEAGDVFEKVLTFASRSRSRTGRNFSVREMGPLSFGNDVTLHGFRLPSSENFYVFRHGNELTMIDTGHGIYFKDMTTMLRERSLDPANIKRIFITHPDTDHAGASGYFEKEFTSEVFMHPGSSEVINSMNRAAGAVSPSGLLNLNKYYTRLSSRFTECRFPSRITYFPLEERGTNGKFRIIAGFSVGPLAFDVLESHGGHTPGLVFYLNREHGLLFTSDFLLNVPSLTPEEKEHLSIYRYLLTSPNSDTRVYTKEVEALQELLAELDEELKGQGRKALVFPGHGDYYAFRDMK